MVSLINHEYSRREAHGRLAWQFMVSNAMPLNRSGIIHHQISLSAQAGGLGCTLTLDRCHFPMARCFQNSQLRGYTTATG
jgi:hypothetical protein